MATKSYSLGTSKRALSKGNPTKIKIRTDFKEEIYKEKNRRPPTMAQYIDMMEGKQTTYSSVIEVVDTFFVVYITTDYIFYENSFDDENEAKDFLYKLTKDLDEYYDVQPYYFERLFAAGKSWSASAHTFYTKEYARQMKKEQEREKEQKAREAEQKAREKQEEKLRQKEARKKEEEKREKEYGWLDLSPNNVDLRLPESSLSVSRQNQIITVCNSKFITLFEDFDKRYCIMYFELQPTSFSESIRFAFKQISSPEEYESVRNTKECRNAAMRCILPVLDTISRTCDNVEEDKVFDLIDGKIERLCFHGKVKEDLANKDAEVEADSLSENEISIPIQLSIPSNARKCSLSDGKDGNYNGYKAYIECSFDTGKLAKYIYYENSLTEDVDNYLQCPVPKDDRRKAKGDIINVLKNAGFYADFEAIEKFKAKVIKTLIMNR